MTHTLEDVNWAISELPAGGRMFLRDVPEDVYHASTGVGSTLMKAATRSLRHFKHLKDTPFEHNDSMILGTALHCHFLEPAKFEGRYVKMPDTFKRRAGKEWDEFEAEKAAKGQIILTATQWEQVIGMGSSLREAAFGFFEGGQPEFSCWFHHPVGVVMKARIDYQQGDAAVDVKTTRHEDDDSFAKAVKYDYAIQDAHYRLTTDLPDMLFVGVSSVAPHPCFLSRPPDAIRELAEKAVIDALNLISVGEMIGSYPLKPLELTISEASSWDLNKYQR